MDTRNSALILVLYLAGAALVVGVAIYAYQRSSAASIAALEQLDEDSNGPQASSRKKAPSRAGAIANVNPSLRNVRSSLAMTREALEKRTRALNHKNAECQALKAELDESLALILSLLADEANNARGRDDGVATAKLDSELSRLKEAIARSEMLDVEQEQHIAELQAYLMESDLELASVEQQSNQELDALLAEMEALDAAASEVIARSGIAAVPALIDLLSDDRTDVRKWAAKTLGVMGADAQDAQLALRDLLSDPDPAVRSEAEYSLSLLSGELARGAVAP